MGMLRFVAAAAVSVAVQTPAAPQTTPDFSGLWQLDPALDRLAGGGSGAGRGGGGGRGGGIGLGQAASRLDIVQEAATLTITHRFDDGPHVVVYALDGTDRANKVPVGRGGVADATYRSRWDGAKLVTMIRRRLTGRAGSQTVEYRETIALDDGRLVVETRVEGGPRPGGRTSVYRKY
jgi:hypothetical protein